MLLAAGREVVSKTSAYNITKLSYCAEVRVNNVRYQMTSTTHKVYSVIRDVLTDICNDTKEGVRAASEWTPPDVEKVGGWNCSRSLEPNSSEISADHIYIYIYNVFQFLYTACQRG